MLKSFLYSLATRHKRINEFQIRFVKAYLNNERKDFKVKIRPMTN